MRGLNSIFIFLFLCQFNGLRAQLITDYNVVDSVIQSIEEIEDPKERIDSLNSFAFQKIFNSPSLALYISERTFQAGLESNYQKGIARSLSIMGSSNWSMGNYSKAMKCYINALEIYDSLKDYMGQAIIYNNIAEVYKRTEEYEKSVGFHKKSIEVKKNYLKDVPIVTSYNNLGEIYILLSKVDSASYYFQLAGQIANEADNKRMVALSLMGKGKIAFLRNEMELAKTFYDSASSILSSLSNSRDLFRLNLYLVELYNTDKKYALSDSIIAATMIYTKEKSMNDIYFEALNKKVELDTLKGEWNNALKSITLLRNFEKELQLAEHKSKIADDQARYMMEKSVIENKVLREESHNKTLIIAVIAIGLAALLIVVFFYYIQLRTKSRLNAELSDKNKVIQSKNREINDQTEKLMQMNENLEMLVRHRTEKLLMQNKKLADYAFLNSHQLRSPVASILGIIELLKAEHLGNEGNEMVKHLRNSAEKLRDVTNEINDVLEEIELITESIKDKQDD